MDNDIFELTENLEILTNQKLTFNNYSLFGVKLLDNIDSINKDLITSTRMEPLPENSKNWSLEENEKVYITQHNVKREYTLDERIRAIKENQGRLFTNEKFGFGIIDKKVVEFIIPEYKIKQLSKINRDNIEEKFGKADFVEEDYDYQHSELMNTFYIYTSRKMKIVLDEWDNKINFIFLGEELNK